VGGVRRRCVSGVRGASKECWQSPHRGTWLRGAPWLIRCRRDEVGVHNMIITWSCRWAHRQGTCRVRQPVLSSTPMIIVAGLGSLAGRDLDGDGFAAQLVINRRLTHGPTP
jgi:hypothetical protein